MKKKAVCIIVFGLSGAGKSTLSKLIFNKVQKKIGKTVLLDGNEIREFFTSVGQDYGFSKSERSKTAKPVEQSKGNAVVAQNKTVLNTNTNEEGVRVKSPIIGTAYLAPEPGAKSFVKIGDKVKKGQTVMIVEAMKTMNHVPSTSDGEVKKILVEDGQPVEFGQTLVLLK